MSEIDRVTPNDSEQPSLAHPQNGVSTSAISNKELRKKTLKDEKRKDKSSNHSGTRLGSSDEISLSFEENVQRAVEDVATWPDWKVKSMRSVFPRKKEWKIKRENSQRKKPRERHLSFEENVQRAVEDVATWPDWKVKSMRSVFPRKKEWKIKRKEEEEE